MIIKSIKLKNFLCYYGDNNTFEFSEGLNIVLGANGYGKSKLYDAFQWVFNDCITHPQNGTIKTETIKGGLVSEKAKHEAGLGDKIETRVTLEVISHTGDTYQISRFYFVNKNKENEFLEGKNSRREFFKQNVLSFNPVPESEYDDVLERLIPAEVRPYVWFQGERGVNSLIDTSNDQSLKNVIRRLSDIDRWDRYIDVAKKAYSSADDEFTKALRASNKNKSEIAEASKKKEGLEREISRLEESIENTKKNEQLAKEKIEKLLVNLDNARLLDELQRDEKRIEEDLRKVKFEIDEFYERFNKKIFTNFWILKGTGHFIEAFEYKYNQHTEEKNEQKAKEKFLKGEIKVEKDYLPQGVPEPVHIKKMLELEMCTICNRPAHKGSDAYNSIEQRLPIIVKPTVNDVKENQNLDVLYRKIYHNGLRLKDEIYNVEDNIKLEMLKLSSFNQKKQRLEDSYSKKKEEIQEQLAVGGGMNAKDVINSFEVAKNDSDKYLRKLTIEENELTKKEHELNSVIVRLTGLSEGEVSEVIKQKRSLFEDLLNVSKRVKEQKYQELVRLLEDKTNEHYSNINKKTGAFYGKIKFEGSIDTGFRPAIIDNNGSANNVNTSVISSMKLSIIMAIMSANKNKEYTRLYPLISDAPVSDFDTVKTAAFLQETSNTFNQSIVIMKEMLVKDGSRENRYSPDFEELRKLRDEVENLGKKIRVLQIDLPDGVSNTLRQEIEVSIKTVNF